MRPGRHRGTSTTHHRERRPSWHGGARTTFVLLDIQPPHIVLHTVIIHITVIILNLLIVELGLDQHH